jgi:hypothetical protein
MLKGGKMSEQLQGTLFDGEGLTPTESPSCQWVSPANLTALRENVKRLLMSVIYGPKRGVSFAKLTPDGCWLKTCRGFCQASMDGSLEEFSGTWPKWGIVSDGEAGALVMSEPTTGGNGCSLLLKTPSAFDATVRSGKAHPKFGDSGSLAQEIYGGFINKRMWRTPEAGDSANRAFAHNSRGEPKLSAQVLVAPEGLPPPCAKMWPTPKSSDYKGSGPEGSKSQIHDLEKRNLKGCVMDATGSQLNFAWVSWLMGFPPDWTEIGGE